MVQVCLPRLSLWCVSSIIVSLGSATDEVLEVACYEEPEWMCSLLECGFPGVRLSAVSMTSTGWSHPSFFLLEVCLCLFP